MKRFLRNGTIFIVFLFMAAIVPARGAAGNLDATFRTRVEQSGDVRNTAVQADGKIIVVGSFGKFNERAAGNIARLNADGSLDETFNAGAGTNFYIRKAFVQPDGKIIIIGPFTTVGGAARRGIARLNADGTLDESFVPAALNFDEETTTNGFTNATGVYSLALQPDGKMIVGGLFHVLPNPQRNLVRLNADGSLDTEFIGSAGAGTVGVVFDLALQPDGKTIAVGVFGSFLSQARQNLARLNADGTLDPNYAPQGGTDQPINTVKLLPDGKALVGGNFNYFYTQYPSPNQDTFVQRRGLARLNADGSVDTSFNAGEFPPVIPTEISVHADGKILASGGAKMARFLPDGALDPLTENIYVNSEIMTVKALPDGKILTGGRFTRYAQDGGQTNIMYRNGLARLDAGGVCDPGFDPGTGAVSTKYDAKIRIRTIEPLADGKFYIAGRFNLVNGRSRPNFARLNADGSLDETFNPLFEFAEIDSNGSSELTAVAVQPNGCVVTGGTFNGYGGALTSFINRFCAGGGHDPSFMTVNNTFILPFAFEVLPDGKILAAGVGLNAGSGADIIRIKAGGGIDDKFSFVNTNSGIYALARQADGRILIGGDFTGINDTPRRGIARLNADGSFDFDFLVGTSADGAVNSIAVQPDGKILLGGAFNTVRGFARKGIARVEANGEMDPSFAPGAGFNAPVSSIFLQPDGKIVAGGAFFLYNNFSANQVARLNPDGALDPVFNAGGGTNSGGNVFELAPQNDKIIAAGDFISFNDQNRPRLARLNTSAAGSGAAAFDFDGDGKTDISIFRPASGEWWLNRSTAGVSVAQFGASFDVLAPADYTGDGKTDVALFRAATGEWFILRSEDNSFYSVPFGSHGDIPAPGDFDADGKADPAVFRPSNGTWYVSKSTGGTLIQQFGVATDKPVAADYDGDGKTDLAVYRPAVSEWWILRSSAGLIAGRFGAAGDRAVPGDYSGDGRADTAVFRPATGEWFVLRSEDNSFYSVPFGASGDVPAPGDYDGDGRFDTAVFRPSTATWFVERSSAGTLIMAFGAGGDAAVPGVFVR